ncbi:hypothetical protein B0O99DRAFT_614980 [Bisporella sp. PMI_857]|nr:hypothetical protein B0O99DRAFT_614980 [Bisporella sp. PMI_857]
MDLDSLRSPTLAGENSNKEVGISNELCNNGVMSNGDSKFSDSTYLENNIGLQICLDLLTCELAAAFFQQHPLEHQIRASKFQIQLLIEGYEVLLWQLQHMGLSEEDLGATEKMFCYWLEVLYYLYDLTQGSSPMNI